MQAPRHGLNPLAQVQVPATQFSDGTAQAGVQTGGNVVCLCFRLFFRPFRLCLRLASAPSRCRNVASPIVQSTESALRREGETTKARNNKSKRIESIILAP